jgi:hypothetical protein
MQTEKPSQPMADISFVTVSVVDKMGSLSNSEPVEI